MAPEKGKTFKDGGGIFEVENGAAAKYPPTKQVDPNAQTKINKKKRHTLCLNMYFIFSKKKEKEQKKKESIQSEKHF